MCAREQESITYEKAKRMDYQLLCWWSVILPENTKRIDHGAFTGCQSIEVLKIPVKTKELGETPFDYCTSLRELYLPQGIEFKGKINDHCSPGFKAHAYN